MKCEKNDGRTGERDVMRWMRGVGGRDGRERERKERVRR